MTGPDSPSAALADAGLSHEVDRVVRRLRSMPLVAVPLDRVLLTAQALADLAAGAAAEPRRAVSQLAPYAAADQIAVLSAEVRRATGALDPAASAALSEAARAVLAELRHVLSEAGR